MTKAQRLEILNRYQKYLDGEPNCDIEPWKCRVCGFECSRYHAMIEHCLGHIRRNEFEPLGSKPVQERIQPGIRPIELE